MTTIYVYDNEMLGDDGENFAAALIDEKGFASDADAIIWFNEAYGYNDYTASFLAP